MCDHFLNSYNLVYGNYFYIGPGENDYFLLARLVKIRSCLCYIVKKQH